MLVENMANAETTRTPEGGPYRRKDVVFSSEPQASPFSAAVAKVESFQANAQTSVDRFLSGEGEELHQVALKAQQADIAFELFTQVRNKVVAAYQEVMRMQV